MDETPLDLRPLVMSLEAPRLFRVILKHSSLKANIPWQRPKAEMIDNANGKVMVWRAVHKSVSKDPDLGVTLKTEWEEQFASVLGLLQADAPDILSLFKLLRAQPVEVGDALVALGRVPSEVWRQVRELLAVAQTPAAKVAPAPDQEERRKLETKLARSHKKETERLKAEKQKAEQEANTKVRTLQNRISNLEEKLRVEQTRGQEREEDISKLKAALAGEKRRTQLLEREAEQQNSKLRDTLRQVESLERIIADVRNEKEMSDRELRQLTASLAVLQARLEAETIRLPALVAEWARTYDWSGMQFVLEKTQHDLLRALQASATETAAGLEEIWSTWTNAESETIHVVFASTEKPSPSLVRHHVSLMWELESSLLVRLAVVRQISHLAKRVEEYYREAGGM